MLAMDAVCVFEYDGSKPAGKGVGFAQLGQVQVGIDECFLRHVLREVNVFDECVGISHGHVLKVAHYVGISCAISGLGFDDLLG